MNRSSRQPMQPQYSSDAARRGGASRQYFSQRQADVVGDRTRNYERDRAQSETDYQRGLTQSQNYFDARQRALTGGDSTGALWGSAMEGGSQQGDWSGFNAADTAYNSETRRQALSGLMGAFQGLGGSSMGGSPPGLNITGPSGPIASVNYQTSINPQQQVYNPQPGMAQMQAAPPQAAGPGGQSFANNYAGMGQANANSLSRGATQAQGQYNLAATQAQQQGALAGLGQQNRAANNQSQRQSRLFGMGTNMMSGLLR